MPIKLKRVYFKKGKAYVKVDEQGEMIVTAGRVEICYRPNDEKLYKASVTNVRPITDASAITGGSETIVTQKKSVKTFDAKKTNTKKVVSKKTSTTASKNKTIEMQTAMQNKDAIHAWTDGACSGNPGRAGSGVLLISGNRKRELSSFLGVATNNIAELYAIKLVLQNVKTKSKPLIIYTDSAYSLGVLTKGWKAKKNPELIAEIIKLIKDFSDLSFVKVAGHAGIDENERADELARLAVQTGKDYDQVL